MRRFAVYVIICIAMFACMLMPYVSQSDDHWDDHWEGEQWQFYDFYYDSEGNYYGSTWWRMGELDDDEVTDMHISEAYHVLRSDWTWDVMETSYFHWWRDSEGNFTQHMGWSYTWDYIWNWITGQ